MNLSTKKSASLKRSASLPQNIAGNKNYIVTVNQDGSLTWYNNTTSAKLENWSFTADDKIISF